MQSSELPGGDAKVARGIHKASGTLHNTVDRIADPAMEAVEKLSYGAHAGIDRLEGGASAIADKVSAKAEKAMEIPNRALESTRQCIVDNPFEAVGAAAVTGLLVGMLWTLGSRR